MMPRLGLSRLLRTLLVLAPPAALAEAQNAASVPLDTALARQYLREAAELTARDAGRLWGRSLAGSLLFVVPATRTLLADNADPAGGLKPFGAFYTGKLAEAEPVANTGVRWGGKSWAMLVWPLPADSLARGVLVAHELWHRVQDSLGLPGRDPPNPHLAARDGRLWLRLEARALRRALEAPSAAARRDPLRDALLFRGYRRRLFPGADSTERLLELNEGLAESTGITLVALTAEVARLLALRRLETLDSLENFERAFAYHTTPAYGIVLDELAPGWRLGLGPGADLGALLGAALGAASAARPTLARSRAVRYGHATLLREETARRARRLAHLAKLRGRFVTGPLLELPLAELKLGFDPGLVEALDSAGTVYGSLRLSDRWGVLQTDASGGLISSDWQRLVVPAPADTGGRRVAGPGWILELAPGWRIVPGNRMGSWTLRPAEVPESPSPLASGPRLYSIAPAA